MVVRLRWFALALGALVLTLGVQHAQSAPTELFISEYIEGSGQNKALEIYNGTGAAVDLAASAYTVFFSFNGGTLTRSIGLTGTVANGDVYVIAQATADAAILAQADQTDTSTSWFNGDDFVALRKNGVTVDGIGQLNFDPGAEWGTGNTSTADNTIRRKQSVGAGDVNEGDAFDPATEWDGFAINTFDGLGTHSISTGGDAAPSVASTSPANGATNVPVNANLEINFSEPVNVNGEWFGIVCGGSGAHTATVTGGPKVYTLNPDADFNTAETCAVTVKASQVTDVDPDDPPDNMATNHTLSFTTTLPLTQIAQVQGTSHLSPFAGQLVQVEGVVIAESGSNVWVQDVTPDADPATSEAILVFGSSVASAVVVGDLVHVSGTVTEFRPGCFGCAPTSSAFDNLTITELAAPGLGVTVLDDSVGLPVATVIGAGGRTPPTTVIENDSDTGNVETDNDFDPAQDGIDFYETLEHMRVQVNNPVVVGPQTNAFEELYVLPDDGAGAGIRTARGGIVIRDVDPALPNPSSAFDYLNGDFNPERIQLDDLFVPGTTPSADVGDHFGTVVGILAYDFGTFELNPTAPLTVIDGGLARETTVAPHVNELSIATFNVENLDPGDTATIPRLARIVVENMRSPDLIAIEEMQDNNGEVNDGNTAANLSWQAFIDAVVAAGGPTYDFRQIDPLNNQDGGAPGGNIRVGFLFRIDRGLSFVDRPGGDAVTPTGVFRADGKAHLTLSPGRVDPLNAAWTATRKPLAGEFVWNDKTLIVIANHLSSKGGDDPLFGRFQPPVRSSEVRRHQQAAVLNTFVDQILAAERKANVVVLGDINDFEFSETTRILTEGGVLTSLLETLPKPERYSYVFEGNSQVLDQILFSENLMRGLTAFDVVHVNAEFADQASDHDPSVARTKVLGGGGGAG